MSYVSYEIFLKKDLSQYKGSWIAIIEKEIVANDKDVNRLINKVKKDYPHKVPFITKIKDKLAVL